MEFAPKSSESSPKRFLSKETFALTVETQSAAEQTRTTRAKKQPLRRRLVLFKAKVRIVLIFGAFILTLNSLFS
tara:strand:- start:608 stop:829 length:222 start_codon:yes stop_codon:yes gene_type:complete